MDKKYVVLVKPCVFDPVAVGFDDLDKAKEYLRWIWNDEKSSHDSSTEIENSFCNDDSLYGRTDWINGDWIEYYVIILRSQDSRFNM